jgi:penicillin-binding protein 1A
MRTSAREILDAPPPETASSKPAASRWARVRPRLLFWLKWTALISALLAVTAVLAVFALIRHFEADLPSVTELKGNYHPPQVTRVLARDGTLLAELFTERRTVVPIGSLPAHVKLAVLAGEDAGFYEHEGLNYVGIARAFLVNLREGRTRQGGSTITQQVVKNIVLKDSRRTVGRKLREALLSRRLETELTKDEILELYMNQSYFGHGRYGIEEAARGDFGKSAKDLTIGEAALLAGRIPRPETCSPRHDMKCAITYRDHVLDQMHEKKFLPDAAWTAAKQEAVNLAPEIEANSGLSPEAIEIAKRTLRQVAGDDASRGGYTITTTIDPHLQEAARKSVRDGLMAYDKRHGLQGPLKVPPVPTTAGRKGHAAPPPSPKDAPFEGTTRRGRSTSRSGRSWARCTWPTASGTTWASSPRARSLRSVPARA